MIRQTLPIAFTPVTVEMVLNDHVHDRQEIFLNPAGSVIEADISDLPFSINAAFHVGDHFWVDRRLGSG
jgi:hypothetical protein